MATKRVSVLPSEKSFSDNICQNRSAIFPLKEKTLGSSPNCVGFVVSYHMKSRQFIIFVVPQPYQI